MSKHSSPIVFRLAAVAILLLGGLLVVFDGVLFVVPLF
jgi:hypothetical protein